jgi:hypothetical protein
VPIYTRTDFVGLYKESPTNFIDPVADDPVADAGFTGAVAESGFIVPAAAPGFSVDAGFGVEFGLLRSKTENGIFGWVIKPVLRISPPKFLNIDIDKWGCRQMGRPCK